MEPCEMLFVVLIGTLAFIIIINPLRWLFTSEKFRIIEKLESGERHFVAERLNWLHGWRLLTLDGYLGNAWDITKFDSREEAKQSITKYKENAIAERKAKDLTKTDKTIKKDYFK